MRNFTRNHKCTSIGNQLIQTYAKLLLPYEQAHPQDIGGAPLATPPMPPASAGAALPATSSDKLGKRANPAKLTTSTKRDPHGPERAVPIKAQPVPADATAASPTERLSALALRTCFAPWPYGKK